MQENTNNITLRSCYDSSGEIIDDRQIQDFEPLKELLEMFTCLRAENDTASFDKAG